MGRHLVRGVLTAATAAGAAWVVVRQTSIGHSVAEFARKAERDVRYARATVPGITYRLRGRQPAIDVDDATLTDRVRSTLGPLEKALDLPRIHIMVDHRVARLDGDVSRASDTRRIERAVRAVAGIADVDSRLHIGLVSGDTRPSEGVHPAPSEQYQRLVHTARDAGALEEHRAVRAIMLCFLARLPEGERAHVWTHLQRDLRDVTSPPLQHDDPAHTAHTFGEFAGAVAARAPSDRERMPEIIRAVFAALRTSVPEEAADVAATLPSELRQAWLGEPVGASLPG